MNVLYPYLLISALKKNYHLCYFYFNHIQEENLNDFYLDRDPTPFSLTTTY